MILCTSQWPMLHQSAALSWSTRHKTPYVLQSLMVIPTRGEFVLIGGSGISVRRSRPSSTCGNLLEIMALDCSIVGARGVCHGCVERASYSEGVGAGGCRASFVP